MAKTWDQATGRHSSEDRGGVGLGESLILLKVHKQTFSISILNVKALKTKEQVLVLLVNAG